MVARWTGPIHDRVGRVCRPGTGPGDRLRGNRPAMRQPPGQLPEQRATCIDRSADGHAGAYFSDPLGTCSLPAAGRWQG